MKGRVWKYFFVVCFSFMLFGGLYAENDLPYEMGMKSSSVDDLMKSRFAASPSTTTIYQSSLPSRVDLSSKFPPIRSQGMQSSCVAWSVAYATKSYQEKIERGWAYSESTLFSPAYVYNQINGGQDRGSAIEDAMNLIQNKGCAPLSKMPYNPSDYRTQPNSSANSEAQKYKAKNWHYVRYDDLQSIKSHLASGQPVNFGMSIDAEFYNLSKVKYVYNTTAGYSYGGHAMVLAGYDDNFQGGCFKIFNSWGTDWGDNGTCWITYNLWLSLKPHVLVMYDMVDTTPTPSPTDTPEVAKPGKVTGVSATKGTYSDKIVLTWNSTTGATGYTVYASSESTGPWIDLDNVDKNEYYFETTGQGKLYFVVRAYNTSGYGDESEVTYGFIKEPIVETPVPEPPINIKASQGEYADKIAISWKASDGASSYTVYKRNSDGQWKAIGKTKETSYTDTAPGKEEEQAYAVSALNQSGESGLSVIAVGYVKKKPTVTSKPSVPQGVNASRGTYSDRIAVQWQAAKGAEEYKVYRYSLKSYSWEEIATTPGTEYVDKNIVPNLWYTYSISAGNALGYSELSIASYGIAKASAKLSLPKAPSFVQASKGDIANKVKITWGKVDNADYYLVYRWSEDATDWQKIAKTAETSYFDSAVKKDTFYVYTVSANNSVGFSKNNPFDYGYTSFSYSSGKAAGKVKDLQASQGFYGDGVKLLFTPIKGISRYVVFRRSQQDSSWKEITEVKEGKYIDRDVQKGIIYEYCVAPSVPGGVPSEVAKGWVAGKFYTKPPLAPTKIMNSGKKYKDRNIFSWDVTFETEGYYIYRYDEERKKYIKIGYTMDLAYADRDNIVPGKTYKYGVRAFNWAGESKDMLTTVVAR